MRLEHSDPRGGPDVKRDEEHPASTSYRKPKLTKYGSLKTLTLSTAVTANGDAGQNMMT